ncbi:MAG: LysR family transcriptional regulator [Psychromonas sp.]
MFEYIKSMVVFTVVVEVGSFRKAATNLSLSPSVVSQYINKLESHLGAPLFYRSTRKLSLTDYGKRLYPNSRQMMLLAETGLNDLRQGHGKVTGKLNITLPANLMNISVAKTFADFCEEFPHIELSVNVDNRRHNMIEEGIDLAIRVGWLEDSNLKAKKIMDIKRVICASRKYLSRADIIKEPKDLESHNWVKTELLLSSVELKNAKLGKTEIFNVKKGISMKGANVSKEMMLADFGLSLGPRFLVQSELQNGELIEVLPDWQAQTPGMYFVWVDNTVKNPLINYFTDFSLERLRNALATV